MGSAFSQKKILDCIKEYLDTTDFNKKQIVIKKQLDLPDFNRPIKYKSYDEANRNKLATISNESNEYDLSKINVVMFVWSIASAIDNVFDYREYIDKQEEYKIISKVIVLFILFHEFVHVRQVKQGMTVENYRNNKETYECEADKKAYKFITSFGEKERKIIDKFLENRSPSVF